MREIILLVGVPGVGKTWITKQVEHKYDLCHHDLYIKMAGDTYVKELLKASENVGPKPVLGECPFSISAIEQPLRAAGRKVTLKFICENDRVVTDRYFKREKKPIPPGHLSRQRTYRQRARETGSFMGTSEEVLKHLLGE